LLVKLLFVFDVVVRHGRLLNALVSTVVTVHCVLLAIYPQGV